MLTNDTGDQRDGACSRRRDVVTGLGAVTPLGLGATRLHGRWATGDCGIVDGAGACTEFEPRELLSLKQIRMLDRFSQLALVAADKAVAQADWTDGPPYAPMRIGCVIATGIGRIETVERQHGVMRNRGAKMLSPLGIPLYIPNAGAAAVSMKYGLQGQLCGVVSACSGSALAVDSALRMIQYGDAEVAVAGGAEAVLTAFGFACFNSMQALSPPGISHPFDARRDAFVVREGAGVLVLEDADAALRRGAAILGELIGYGSTADAYHLIAPQPNGELAAPTVEFALQDVGVTADVIAYHNAHGTSSQLHGATENFALKQALGEERPKQIPVSSAKSAIGYLLSAAGAVEAVATVETLATRVILPTSGYDVPNPELDLDYVPGQARPLLAANGGPPSAISNSFAFGGHNVALVLRGASG